MTREEAIADIRDNIKPIVGGKSLDMAIQSLTAISELSKSLKAVNRYEMDEKVLIGFNMAVAIFNKCFGKVGEQTDGNVIQPKMGKWIDDKCSVCGKGIEDLIASPEWYRNEEPSFCPFCGAKMQEVKNES
jgi:hypothetical protein